ncbi:hypothetical protein PVAND_010841 [Polypedilum vanderplanki]|uniref:TOG domain-containing protein n=1 Tax=Polypedilum vanderplanki TaxID=319348 RepID=A0A9J6CI32_POLVA|nr:hypothetical protein PVAND_010841 [Polypedilum vanderplanki]
MATEDENEYKKLPVEERCVHKLWKARVDGYEEAAKLFRTIDDEKGPEWNKFMGLIKKFVVDSNALAQEKGLEAALVFVENCGNAGKTVGDVMTGIVTKCLGAPKAKTKDLGMQIALMYIEIEKHDAVVEELIKGFDQKNPKIVSACISTILLALREFGAKVINVKPLVKKIPTILSDRDKTVREESKQLTIEIFRWIGPVFKTQIQSIPQVVLNELEAEFEKVKNDRAVPTRYLRSQQDRQISEAVTGAVDGGGEDVDGENDDVAGGEEIDPMDLIDPVEILSKLPKDFYEKLEAKKWTERKEALEALEPLVSNPKIENGDFGDLVRALKKVITKDTNVVLVALGGKCLALLAKGLSKKFQPYAVVCTSGILEKFKEKKANVVTALREAIDAIYPSTNLEAIQEDVLAALANKNPSIKTETSLFLARSFTKTQPSVLNKKLLKVYVSALLKNLSESDPAVRDAAAEALGTAMKLVGEKNITPFLTDVDALKMEKIKEYYEKAVITVKIIGVKKPVERPQTAPVKPRGGTTEPTPVARPNTAAQKKPPAKKAAPSGGISKSASTKNVQPTNSYGDDDDDEPQSPTGNTDQLSRVDISPLITESLIAEISDKNWKTRNEGLEKLKAILNEHKLIKSSLGELPPILAQRLCDSNAKIAQLAVEICQQLATSIGAACKQHIRVLLPGILRGLGDNKAYLRQACIACMNTWGDQCGYKEFFDGEMFADALKSGTPSLRTEVWGWMAEKLPNIPPKSINKEELVACLPHLYANITDRNVDVRKNANDCVLGIMMHLGYEAMVKAMDKQKPSSKKDIQAALDKARPNLPVKPLPKSKQQAPIATEEKKVVKVGGGSKIGKPAISKPGSAPVASSRRKEEEVDTSPLFQVNNLKQQRFLDEQKLKVLRWTFTTPREEFTDLLKEQMINANVNKSLIANMFHDDFRYHLKVIDSLVEDLPGNTKGLMCNLDLVLKWLSLRFYDTNPSVLLKGLDYLNLVFQTLRESQYVLTECEGSSFIPHLLTKIGDPKDAVRNGVRQLLRQICLVYPFSKVFTYLMDALKSKNARQRTECLDELGYLIETYNLTVCQPTPQHALKEIARQISDRDNSVRSAALNCIVKAYELAGDKIYKMIGQLSEKEMSMLDERIKRSKKNPKVQEVKPSPSSVEIVNVPIEKEEDSRELSGEDELPSEEEPHPNLNRTYESTPPSVHQLQQPRVPSGPFGLNPDVIADIEKDWTRADQIKLSQFSPIDLAFIDEPIQIKTCNGVSYPVDRLNQLLAKSPSRPHSANVTLYSASSPQRPAMASMRPATAPEPVPNLMENLPKYDTKLLNIIKGIGHPDQYVSHASLNELSDIVESQEKQAVLRDYEEIYIQSVLAQFKHLSQRPLAEAVPLYQPLLNSIYHFFTSKTLGQNLNVTSIKNIISVLLGLMSDHKLGTGEEYTKVINSICLKILDRCNFTHLNCALVRLLKETCSGSALPKFTELLMKCIWRNVKLMPERVNELDYEALLLEIHDFMLALPTSWWAQRPSDTPMRTIKTIIHNMTKIKGAAILQHLNNIPKHSELNTYVLRILKKDQALPSGGGGESDGIHAQQQRSQQDRSNRNTQQLFHDQVGNIFKLLSDKETSKLGLKQLYEFKENHPEVDIQPFLRGSSTYFQQFIQEGLAELQNASHNNNTNNNQLNEGTTAVHAQGAVNPNNPDYWMQKLNMYRIRGKLQTNEEKEPIMDNKIADENLNMNQIQSRLTTVKKEANHIPADRLELLQQKLAQYKPK